MIGLEIGEKISKCSLGDRSRNFQREPRAIRIDRAKSRAVLKLRRFHAGFAHETRVELMRFADYGIA